ncbi:hypothetical protein HYFRA_00004227 [Hymenoscyphus fraxineus]|uniref:Pleckstrin homology domain-containing protein n=1 Tax=Hymenoscyphus fraxineus TaxID=746836 RepID=A0A9N9PNP3_9HELO|nr:hypothetical protein HYFRA_00004227 [Hymenoscyphus fraxineus]
MTGWETEDEYAAAATASLPPRTDIPHRTNSRASRSSKKSSRQKSISPAPSSSSLLSARRDTKDIAQDESISILDPRRFTPTLHANLVSEILALRRDQEEKLKTIENLEDILHTTQEENEQYQEAAAIASKEIRGLKRQVAVLEDGGLYNASELAKERDEAVDSNAEFKKRLDVAQKKIRSQEDDSIRVHDLWAQDKDNWEEEKRKLERKAHVAEGRLKTVLEEVAAYQAARQQQQHPESDVEKDPDHSDSASVRTMSMTNSVRYSILSGPNGYGGVQINGNGMSLADELNFDDDDDDTQTEYDGGRESVLSMRHQRTQSRESTFSRAHRRNQSHESMMRSGSIMRRRLLAKQLEHGILESDETVSAPVPKVEYTDTGVQFSPPPSPQQPVAEAPPIAEDLPALETNGAPSSRPNSVQRMSKQWENETQPREWEVEANQRRKRVNPYPSLTIDPPSVGSMVSAASQTVEDPLSPPRTPVSPTRASPAPPMQTQVVQARETASTSTQTNVEDREALGDVPPTSPRQAPPPQPILVPSIQLHPPNDSSPPSPREPVLPQYFKDAACQVTMQAPIPSRSVSVQTEEIRVDQRIKLLPPHLQPLSISSTPPSPEPPEENQRFSPVPGNLPPRNPRRVMTPRASLDQDIPSSPPSFPDIEIRDSYPGNNDDGPLAKGKGSVRRPPRISSLFAGFENVSSDDADDFEDGDMSDSDYRTALSAPRPSRGSKRHTMSPTSVPEDSELTEVTTRMMPGPGRSALKLAGLFAHENETQGEYGSVKYMGATQRNPSKPVRQLDKPLTLVSSTKPNPMRRAALISSGVAAHRGRSESPLPDAVREPPFPIPLRASSRKPPPLSANSAPGDRSPTWGRGSGVPHRTNSIRKVRSAAALPRGNRAYRRQDSHSPPPMSPSTEGPESPRLPPMPENELTSPAFMRDTGSGRYRPRHRQQLSVTTAYTANTTYTASTINTGTASVANSNQATTVVDAIAQTMVGEWMFKYVRRRKSFGVADASGMDGDGVNGVRHKRWVWLAPYERAVMWSSKQPTSGSALMGKTGRKLTIQSVLDVKDDNPPPKGTPAIFDRSILILTPARALKFTATSAERHYIWLTALSFLAHSTQAVPEIVTPVNPSRQPALPDFEPPRVNNHRIRRRPIQDSIRIAKGKGKTSSVRSGPTSVHSALSAEQSIREEASFYTSRSDGGLPPADPPIVPRFPERGDRSFGGPPLTHTRKRSNTGSRFGPPSSYRGFSAPQSGYAPPPSTAGMSVGTSGSSDIYNSKAPSSVSGYTAVSGLSSVRSSEASNRPGAVVNNFFDAVGTVRMEAFISPMAHTQFDDDPDEKDEMDMVLQHRKHSRERRRRSRNRDSFYSARGRTSDDMYGGSRTAGEEDYGHFDTNNFSLDPFRGF